jgi:hypothetical protein
MEVLEQVAAERPAAGGMGADAVKVADPGAVVGGWRTGQVLEATELDAAIIDPAGGVVELALMNWEPAFRSCTL